MWPHDAVLRPCSDVWLRYALALGNRNMTQIGRLSLTLASLIRMISCDIWFWQLFLRNKEKHSVPRLKVKREEKAKKKSYLSLWNSDAWATTAAKTSLKNLIRVLSYQSSSRLFESSFSVKRCWIPVEVNSWEPYPSSERERNFRRRSFNLSLRLILHIHLELENRRRNLEAKAKTCTKKVCCTCKDVVLIVKPIVFSTFSLPSPSPSPNLQVPMCCISALSSDGWFSTERWKNLNTDISVLKPQAV